MGFLGNLTEGNGEREREREGERERDLNWIEGKQKRAEERIQRGRGQVKINTNKKTLVCIRLYKAVPFLRILIDHVIAPLLGHLNPWSCGLKINGKLQLWSL